MIMDASALLKWVWIFDVAPKSSLFKIEDFSKKARTFCKSILSSL